MDKQFKIIAYTNDEMRPLGIIYAKNQKEAEKIARERLKAKQVSTTGITQWKFIITEEGGEK